MSGLFWISPGIFEYLSGLVWIRYGFNLDFYRIFHLDFHLVLMWIFISNFYLAFILDYLDIFNLAWLKFFCSDFDLDLIWIKIGLSGFLFIWTSFFKKILGFFPFNVDFIWISFGLHLDFHQNFYLDFTMGLNHI